MRIEIQQELTLERQAFDAHMRITNGLDTTDLENIEINVWFLDSDDNPVLASSDPDNDDAAFFITQDETSGITGGISGNGTIAATAQADIHWLIIPAPGAGGELPSGQLFQVGATLSYSYGGESETVEVAPDFIRVRPMPRLSLDYFLPDEVLGDDPLTPETEPSVPFPLAVRVKNSGFGPANDMAIESAQPEIVDNDQGLLINFELLNTQVNDGEVSNSLLAEFGDLPPGKSATAIWSMLVSLYGHFISFEADYYHSDSLGGELTSLIDRVDTHTLVGLVRNDLPGRDARRDFLARPNGGDTLALFESSGADAPVEDVSSQSVLELVDQSAEEQVYEMTFPALAGAVYSVLPDPTGGEGEIASVWRSDGKQLLPVNYWTRPSKVEGQWVSQVHLFDVNSSGEYQITYTVTGGSNQPPELDPVSAQSVAVGQPLQIEFTASDPDGDSLNFSIDPMPEGAGLTDNGDGSATLNWQPQAHQAGTYNPQVSVSDGALSDQQVFEIEVTDTAGEGEVLVNADLPLATGEDGLEDQFTIVLSQQPDNTVSVPVASSDTDEGMAEPAVLTFDAGNWDQPQSVTVSGVDDAVLDGDAAYQIQIGPTVSEDTTFDGLTATSLEAVNNDDDTASLQVSPDTGLATAGANSSAALTVSLSAEPLEPVTVSVQSSQSAWGQPDVSEVVFDAQNWQSGESIEIVGQDGGGAAPGEHTYEVLFEATAGEAAWTDSAAATVDILHRAGETWGVEAGTATLPAVSDTGGFASIPFSHPFEAVPVVVTIPDDAEANPATVRIRNVTTSGFEAVQVQPPAQFDLSDETEIRYLAVAPGSHLLPGGAVLEAGRVLVDAEQSAGAPGDWNEIAFQREFASPPAFLASLQAMANESASLPQAPSSPWLSVAVDSVDANGASIALERSSVSDGAVDSAETVGWIALDAGQGQFASGAGLVDWRAVASGLTAGPWDNGCSPSSALGIFGPDAIALGSLRSRTHGGGGWLRLCADGGPGLLVDQDMETNTTRGQGDESASAWILSKGFHTRLLQLADELFTDRFEEEQP
ncbi:MAG: hypothetical protein GVY11_02050 [Gammaproteobacteria bacterium]|nr:hypothetical protein [Gammaproteobacteria bacterium]